MQFTIVKNYEIVDFVVLDFFFHPSPTLALFTRHDKGQMHTQHMVGKVRPPSVVGQFSVRT